MFMARVVGCVWSSVKWKGLEGLRLLLVRPYNLDDLRASDGMTADAGVPPQGLTDGVVVADLLGAGPGEDVVIAYGHAGRVGLEPGLAVGEAPHFPVDASVVAIVDRFRVDESAIAGQTE